MKDMKKVTAFIGSAQKKATYQAVLAFENNLKQREDIDFEYVFLSDYRIEFCKSCKQCFDKGEQYCPLKDDMEQLLQKIERSDGVIFATPNYAFQISARMKNFLDRSAYIIHRPRFFGKTFAAIVTQGFFGAKPIRKYLELAGENLGFNIVKGSCLTTLDPMTDKQKADMKREMDKTSKRFYKSLDRDKPPVPTLFRLMLFRMSRSGLKSFTKKYHDYYYYKENGWLESDYYYETSLGLIKKATGLLFDYIGRVMVKRV